MTEHDDSNAAQGFEVDEGEVSGSRKRWGWVVGALVVLALVAVGTVFLLNRDQQTAPEQLTLNTATVQRTDLVVTTSLDGTLGYGSATQLTHRSSSEGIETIKGGRSGVVTSIVGEGTVVHSGEVLYAVNASPVVLFQGDIPQYRGFNSRMSDGDDVLQLETALVAAGFDPDGDITVDTDFTSATAAAIKLLQEEIGADDTGRLDMGDVIFTPTDEIFVAEQLVSVGDQVQSGQGVVATSRAISGTVTAIADEGSVIGQGDILAWIDGDPVALLVGDVPMYRTMSPGAEGEDVRQLEQSLSDLGFGDGDGFMVDGVYDAATATAVANWQTSIGAQADGVVNMGDVQVSPTSVRVGQHLVDVGDPVNPGTPLMTTSASDTFVTVQLSTDDQDLVSAGDAVTVELPSGDVVPATVTDIGTVVQATPQGGTYFDMTVTLDDPSAAQGLDEAPVTVDVISDRADNVLAVPVTALLALAEGGYAVEVVNDDGSTQLVAVDPSLFADGFVAVDSANLSAGMEVVIP